MTERGSGPNDADRFLRKLDAPDWAFEFLKEGRVGRLGTADGDGRPLVVPVCYVFDGRLIYSPIDAKPKRTRRLKRTSNISVNPNVSLLVDHYEEDWRVLRYVIVKGRAEVIDEGTEFCDAVEGLKGKYPQYEDLPLEREGGSVIKISPDRVTCWRFLGD